MRETAIGLDVAGQPLTRCLVANLIDCLNALDELDRECLRHQRNAISSAEKAGEACRAAGTRNERIAELTVRAETAEKDLRAAQSTVRILQATLSMRHADDEGFYAAVEKFEKEDLSWMTREDAIVHYQCMLMNHASALDRRDEALARVAKLEECLRIAEQALFTLRSLVTTDTVGFSRALANEALLEIEDVGARPDSGPPAVSPLSDSSPVGGRDETGSTSNGREGRTNVEASTSSGDPCDDGATARHGIEDAHGQRSQAADGDWQLTSPSASPPTVAFRNRTCPECGARLLWSSAEVGR